VGWVLFGSGAGHLLGAGVVGSGTGILWGGPGFGVGAGAGGFGFGTGCGVGAGFGWGAGAGFGFGGATGVVVGLNVGPPEKRGLKELRRISGNTPVLNSMLELEGGKYSHSFSNRFTLECLNERLRRENVNTDPINTRQKKNCLN
jgi:hypothetical protein